MPQESTATLAQNNVNGIQNHLKRQGRTNSPKVHKYLVNMNDHYLHQFGIEALVSIG